jgi:hypothetical protein
LFQRFTVVVNNMRANVHVLSYDDHDRDVKLLHTIYQNVWDRKVEAILEFKKYTTLTVKELFSKLKSAEVDHGLIAHLESSTDSHSLSLVGGKVAKSNSNASSRMYSLSSLMSLLHEEFDVLGEDKLVLRTRWFERLHENWVNTKRIAHTCFQCGKPGHFVANCPEKTENKDGYKDAYKHRSSKDGKYRSRRDHKHKKKHKDERRLRKKDGGDKKARAMVKASDIDSSAAYSSSSSSSSDDMNPLGFVPDLSMRGVDNSIEEEMTFSARLQPFKAAP